jgi:hypothetical protein
LLLYAVAAAVPKCCCLIVVHIYFVSGGRRVADLFRLSSMKP